MQTEIDTDRATYIFITTLTLPLLFTPCSMFEFKLSTKCKPFGAQLPRLPGRATTPVRTLPARLKVSET